MTPTGRLPLDADYLGNRLLGTKGLLTAEHPYHRYADVTHFLARREGRAVGRVSAAINHRFNEHTGESLGFFGFFEVEEDYEAAAALLDAARAWIADRGMKAMRGPGEYSNATHERQGVLIRGFDTPPTVECTHNPPYYGEFLERWGLAKVKDYHAYYIELDKVPVERLEHLERAVRERSGVQTRTADMDDFSAEVRRVIEVYNQAWADNWGFLPITPDEADAIADTLKPIVDPNLIRFASIDDKLVAMLGAFPDPNWALQPHWGPLGDSDPVRVARLLAERRHIPRVRLMFFGIVPGYRKMGIDALMYAETYRYAVSQRLQGDRGVAAARGQRPDSAPSQFAGGELYKTWRIYQREL